MDLSSVRLDPGTTAVGLLLLIGGFVLSIGVRVAVQLSRHGSVVRTGRLDQRAVLRRMRAAAGE